MEDDDTSTFESIVEQVRKWRQVADRGVSGRSFSEEQRAPRSGVLTQSNLLFASESATVAVAAGMKRPTEHWCLCAR